MVIELCTCGWELPNVERLPAHQHFDRTFVRSHANGRDREFWLNTSDLWLNRKAVESGELEILEVWVGIHISVDWKQVARALATDQTR